LLTGVFSHKPIAPNDEFVPYEWQAKLIEELKSNAHPREIIWVYDTIGNKGKSTLCTFLATNHGALVVENCKTADIAHAYDSHPIVCWDLVRTSEDKVNYAPMEAVKNGRIFSPKYESGMKIFPVPHVVVVANYPCPIGKFSVDRLRTICLDDVAKFPIFREECSVEAIQARLKLKREDAVKFPLYDKERHPHMFK